MEEAKRALGWEAVERNAALAEEVSVLSGIVAAAEVSSAGPAVADDDAFERSALTSQIAYFVDCIGRAASGESQPSAATGKGGVGSHPESSFSRDAIHLLINNVSGLENLGSNVAPSLSWLSVGADSGNASANKALKTLREALAEEEVALLADIARLQHRALNAAGGDRVPSDRGLAALRTRKLELQRQWIAIEEDLVARGVKPAASTRSTAQEKTMARPLPGRMLPGRSDAIPSSGAARAGTKTLSGAKASATSPPAGLAKQLGTAPSVSARGGSGPPVKAAIVPSKVAAPPLSHSAHAKGGAQSRAALRFHRALSGAGVIESPAPPTETTRTDDEERFF
jgi:hypothetical protein